MSVFYSRPASEHCSLLVDWQTNSVQGVHADCCFVRGQIHKAKEKAPKPMSMHCLWSGARNNYLYIPSGQW